MRRRPAHSRSDARLYCSQGQVQRHGHLVVGQLIKKGQAERLALRMGKRVDRGPHRVFSERLPRGLRGLVTRVAYLVQDFRSRTRVQPRPPAAVPQLVENAVVGNLHEPGSDGPGLRIVGPGFSPDRKKDILDNLLRGPGVQALLGHVEYQGRVPREEQLQRL